MARDGLSSLLCAGLLLGALSPLAAAGDDPPSHIATTLAVQAALQRGREQMRGGDYQGAVKVLEGQLAHIDGSREYLTALRDAYRGLVKSLKLASREAEADLYSRRLDILERGPSLDDDRKSPIKSSPRPAPALAALASLRADELPIQPAKVRAKIDTPPLREAPAVGETVRDPFDTSNHKHLGEARGYLERAEEEFRGGRYGKAGELYALAHQVVPDVTRDIGERWAYCRLHRVVERLNRADGPPSAAELDDLEREVRTAAGMTPKLKEFGDRLLGTIQTRRTASAGPAKEAPQQAASALEPAIKVRHAQAPGTGWAVAETTNFRIFHNQSPAYAEMVAKVAETTRSAMQRKWFGQAGADWEPRCDIYLHADARAYSQATRQPQNSPGNTTIARKGSTVLSRRIDLRVDEVSLLNAVLPHETTHAVLAGRFGPFDLPRWADEGMAVLSEPPERLARYLRGLPQYRQAGQVFAVQQLMQLPDWPDERVISAFYAQSASLTDFLCQQKGPQVFAQFLGDSLRTGETAALKKHYGFEGYQDLNARWRAHAFGEGEGTAGYVQR